MAWQSASGDLHWLPLHLSVRQVNSSTIALRGRGRRPFPMVPGLRQRHFNIWTWHSAQIKSLHGQFHDSELEGRGTFHWPDGRACQVLFTARFLPILKELFFMQTLLDLCHLVDILLNAMVSLIPVQPCQEQSLKAFGTIVKLLALDAIGWIRTMVFYILWFHMVLWQICESAKFVDAC